MLGKANVAASTETE